MSGLPGPRCSQWISGYCLTNTYTPLKRYDPEHQLLLGFQPFTSDISTAFLQGKKYDPTSERELWIRLPREADGLLGLSPGHGRVMKLTKPMYGLVDAPKAWFDEAVDRILKMGDGTIVQHPLDACLFLAFDRALRPQEQEDDPPRLLAIFGIHVDDLLGCSNEQDPLTKKLMDKLRKTFCFREWHSGAERDELSYCGAKITKIDNHHWKIHHSEYFKKQKPISIQKERLQAPQPVTNGERTALRALLGALQWPSTQTAPWLQAAVSLLAGTVSTATTATLQEANKVLRYAKENYDVGLEYRPLSASKDDITFIAFSDASFACRADLSSQGGYLVAMVDKSVANGDQGHYNVLDWRSWELARVSRSTLSAESQAASEAADSLLFTTTFWNLIWRPWLPLDQFGDPEDEGRAAPGGRCKGAV